jgi:large subunit ribosomal protein L3
VLGHFKNLGPFENVVEFDAPIDGVNVGDTMNASVFAAGDTVVVSGVSKGKGFQGVVKRHGFHGGPRSHGQKHSEREPGSIGGGLRNRVPKGMRMAGRMGSDRITTKNLTILAVDPESNVILIKGALPGRRGTLLEVVSK